MGYFFEEKNRFYYIINFGIWVFVYNIGLGMKRLKWGINKKIIRLIES